MQKGLDSTKRFSNRVDNYVRYRPDYPKQIINLLREDCGMTKNSIIADIGSGTGKLATLFVENGNKVFAVEPNKEMREAGDRLLNKFPNFTNIDGTAEATTLPNQCADFITIGQAFHWFDHEKCRAEFSRILKPGGWLVIVWNDRHLSTPFSEEYEKLLREFSMDYERVNHRRMEDPKTVQKFFKNQPQLKNFSNAQQLDFDGIKGRLLSSSYAPESGQPKHREMLAALKQIFETHQNNGRIVLEYKTHVYYGHLN